MVAGWIPFDFQPRATSRDPLAGGRVLPLPEQRRMKKTSVDVKTGTGNRWSAVSGSVFVLMLIGSCARPEQPRPQLAAAATSSNEVVRYLGGAELQAETDQQVAEIKRALGDLLTLPPAELETRRYADYTGKPRQWPLGRLLMKYYVPARAPDSFESEAKLYRDAQAQPAKDVIRGLLRRL